MEGENKALLFSFSQKKKKKNPKNITKKQTTFS